MKKVLALVLALTLLTVPLYAAVATGVDFSSMTDEELTALKQQLDAEMLERGMVKTAVLPMGMYIVGKDIPQGDYELSIGDSDQVGAYYHQYANETDMKSDTFMSSGAIYATITARVNLADGQILQFDVGSVRMTTYTIQWK